MIEYIIWCLESLKFGYNPTLERYYIGTTFYSDIISIITILFLWGGTYSSLYRISQVKNLDSSTTKITAIILLISNTFFTILIFAQNGFNSVPKVLFWSFLCMGGGFLILCSSFILPRAFVLLFIKSPYKIFYILSLFGLIVLGYFIRINKIFPPQFLIILIEAFLLTIFLIKINSEDGVAKVTILFFGLLSILALFLDLSSIDLNFISITRSHQNNNLINIIADRLKHSLLYSSLTTAKLYTGYGFPIGLLFGIISIFIKPINNKFDEVLFLEKYMIIQGRLIIGTLLLLLFIYLWV